LKAVFAMDDKQIECPVRGCDKYVKRRKDKEPTRQDSQLCGKHGLFIYPSTFEYKNETDNLLCHSAADTALLSALKVFKAETNRMGREKSEDAVTWNVFRFMESRGLLADVLNLLFSQNVGLSREVGERPWTAPRLIYWSYCASDKRAWSPLVKARVEFGEAQSESAASSGKRLSEPDLIIVDDGLVMFLEAKFGSGNKTPSGKDGINDKIGNPKRYRSGGEGWIKNVCSKSYEDIIRAQKYELLRMWLLGSWATKSLNSNWQFVLGNLVRGSQEPDIVEQFGSLINGDGKGRNWFVRLTWEQIHACLEQFRLTIDEYDLIDEYFRQKTFGISEDKKNRSGRIGQAFRFG